MMESGSNEAVRHTLQRSADPRVARTRAAILDAVHSLSEQGEELSVSSVVREAGISRASFYSHYASLDELAGGLRRDAFATIADLYRADAGRADAHERADAMRASQERLVAHFAENRALYAAVSALPASKESYLAGVRAMAAEIEETLAAHPARPAELQAAATARYIAGAAYGLLDAWTADEPEPEFELTEEQLVDHLTRLLPPWFSGVR